MKALILALALASTGHAFVLNTTAVEKLNEGMGGTPYGTLTYALNNSLTGTSSSAIDLSGTAGLWLSITTTANPKVDVYFSNSNVTYTTGAYAMYTITAPGSYAIAPKARYVSFYNSGTQPAARLSAFYYTIAPSGSSVSLNPSGASPYPVADTLSYGYLTTTAGGTTGRGGIVTLYTGLTGTANINITASAGVNAPCKVCISSTGANNFYYGRRPNFTWVAPSSSLYAISTTPICMNYGIGDALQTSATASALSYTVEVNIAPIN